MPNLPPVNKIRSPGPKNLTKERLAKENVVTYDYKWRLLSLRFRKNNPLCKICLESKVITEATLVDHIIPIQIAPDRRLDEDNLQSLCKECHKAKTIEDYKKFPEIYSKKEE